MRRCQRIGCENSLDHLRSTADYCSRTCKREAARARAISRDENGAPGFWHRYALIRRPNGCRTRHTAIVAALAAVLLLISGCGGTKTVTVTRTVPAAPHVSQPQVCPPGNSFAGCAQQTVKQAPPSTTPRLAPISGAEFPDVSDWQGPITPNGVDAGVNWSAVKNWERAHGWPAFGIYKAGEFSVDPDAAHNAAALKALGMGNAFYWFVRNTGCAHEASQILTEYRALKPGSVWLDIEVPEAHGYGSCLPPLLKAIPHVGIYTGPGTWPGGGVAAGTRLWDAAYNFTGPQFDGLWTGTAQAWQFTDGTFAARTDVPGIGFDDVNVDKGLEAWSTGGAPAKKDPFAILDRTKRHFRIPAPSPTFGAPYTVVASEHRTMTTIRARGCQGAPRRPVCKSSKFHLTLLLGRLRTVGLREHPHYRIKGQGARQTIMAKQLARLRG